MTELSFLSELNNVHDAFVGDRTSLDANRKDIVAFEQVSLGYMTSCSVEVAKAWKDEISTYVHLEKT